jgi:tetratricopeptide (TPR) repeat protein
MQVLRSITIAVVCTALAAVTIAAYWPVLYCDFVALDDSAYVVENHHVRRGLTLDGVRWAFSTGHQANWHPLTWISHMLDCELFGLDAGLFHLTNLLLHAANAVLLLLVLRAMTGRVWPSAFVAAAFALHPLHVESVAWIAERKDVLSTLFWMLTMAAYVGYARRGGVGRYLLVVVVFALGLTAKPMLVTLPFVLLLLDYWPLGRLTAEVEGRRQKAQSGPSSVVCPPSSPAEGRLPFSSLVAEKLPLFVLAAASCVVTYLVQQAGEAVVALERMPPGLRLSNALVSYVAYIVKMAWPVGLAVLYPLPRQIPLWQPILAFTVLAIATVAFILQARRRRYLAVGWLWYLGTLVPVIGLVQVGTQALADRYSYIPLTGLFIIAAFSAADLCRFRRSLRPVAAAAAVLLLGTMFAGTRKTEEAISHLRRVIELRPEHPPAINDLAWNLATARDPALCDPDKAVSLARKACELTGHENPSFLDTLAVAYASAGRFDEAVSTAGSAAEIAESAGSYAAARQIRNHLELFKQGQSYIQEPPALGGQNSREERTDDGRQRTEDGSRYR